MTANTAPGAKIPPPLATDAGVASRPVAPCCLCARAILRGMRYALLVPSELPAHTPCIARMAETTVRATARS